MKKKTKEALSYLDEVGFLELDHAIGLAKYARNIVKDFNLTEEQLKEKLSINDRQIKAVLWGYYPWDVRMMAKLEAVRNTLRIERDQEIKDKIVQFPDYKDSVPVKYMAQFAEMIAKEFKQQNKI